MRVAWQTPLLLCSLSSSVLLFFIAKICTGINVSNSGRLWRAMLGGMSTLAFPALQAVFGAGQSWANSALLKVSDQEWASRHETLAGALV